MSRGETHSAGIARFIAGWIAAILVAFVLLATGLLVATSKLRAKNDLIFSAATTLQSNHLLELAILNQRRDHLLWHLTKQNLYRRRRDQSLREAGKIIVGLGSRADSSREKDLVRVIEERYQQFRRVALLDPQRATQKYIPEVDRLLKSIHLHRDLNSYRMESTMQSSSRLDAMMSVWSLVLILMTTVVLSVGAVVLWSRIFRPTLLLARAADQFGAGDLKSRAPVLHDDEMGALNRTFNVMADAICNRERDRLDFVATVAHDLRNPLVVIGGAARRLRDKPMTPEQQSVWLSNIIGKTQHMESAIDDLMDAVQIETGRLSLRQEEINLTMLVTEIVREQAKVTRSHTLHFEGGDSCPIVGDRRRLERVVMNLLSNAIKYSPGKRDVWIKVEVHEANAVLTVKDEGVGIDPEELGQLFLPFTRLDKTRDIAPGTGLGLASVKKIVDGHGGSIHVSSKPQVGTTVEVRLPASPQAQSPAPSPRRAIFLNGKPR